MKRKRSVGKIGKRKRRDLRRRFNLISVKRETKAKLRKKKMQKKSLQLKKKKAREYDAGDINYL